MIIKIIGRGAWGESIAQPLRDNGHTVILQGRGMVDISDHDTIILALPTNAIRDALTGIAEKKELRIINCSKGIERTTHYLPYEIVKEVTHASTHYYALLGPSFAEELREKMPTLVNLGYTGSSDQANAIKRLFETEYLRIHTVNHVASLELAAAMKNISAIACGISDGLGFGMNTRIKVIVSAIEEYYVLCKGLHFPLSENAVAGVIGDFMLTGSSNISRNFQFGKYLVEYSPGEAQDKVGATIEGNAALYSLAALIKKANVSLPLVNMLMDIVTEKGEGSIKKQFLAYTSKV